MGLLKSPGAPHSLFIPAEQQVNASLVFPAGGSLPGHLTLLRSLDRPHPQVLSNLDPLRCSEPRLTAHWYSSTLRLCVLGWQRVPDHQQCLSFLSEGFGATQSCKGIPPPPFRGFEGKLPPPPAPPRGTTG